MSSLLCQLDRYMTKHFLSLFWVGTFQWVKGPHDGIVLVVSLLIAIMKDQVALLNE